MENRSKIDLIEIKSETIKEKIIRIFTVLVIVLFPLSLILCFRVRVMLHAILNALKFPNSVLTSKVAKSKIRYSLLPKVVKQYKRAVILRFGRVRSDSPAGPGIIWVVPCTDSVMFIDLRTQSFNLLPQEILTKDSVTVTVDAVVYFHVFKPLHCLLNVQSYKRATELLAIAILRNILGQYTLSDLLTNRESISYAVRREIDKGTAEWGVEVERVEIKDVILPYELQKAMAAEAEGTRFAKAKIIEAEGEIKAAENLRDASKIMMENPQTILLRYLQTLNFLASQQRTSILFPFPIDIPDQHCSNSN